MHATGTSLHQADQLSIRDQPPVLSGAFCDQSLIAAEAIRAYSQEGEGMDWRIYFFLSRYAVIYRVGYEGVILLCIQAWVNIQYNGTTLHTHTGRSWPRRARALSGSSRTEKRDGGRGS